MVFLRRVKRGIEDRGLHRALEIGHFLRALVDEQHHQFDIRMIALNGLRNFLEQHGLARLGRGHNQRPLPQADGRDKVEDAHGRIAVALLIFQG